LAHYQLGEGRQSTRAFRKALALDPDNAVAQEHLVELLLRQGRTEEVISRTRPWVVRHPNDWNMRKVLALSCAMVGRYPEAKRHLEIMLAQRPGSTPTLYALAGVLTHEKPVPTEKIVALLRRAIRLEPGIRNLVRSDPDFTLLNDNPEFRELVGEGK
jgi:predicted Zn-dependent protease